MSTTLAQLDRLDSIDQALTRLEFVSVMLSAWDVEQIPLTIDDLAGLGLFLDDIIEGVRSCRDALTPPDTPPSHR